MSDDGRGGNLTSPVVGAPKSSREEAGRDEAGCENAKPTSHERAWCIPTGTDGLDERFAGASCEQTAHDVEDATTLK